MSASESITPTLKRCSKCMEEKPATLEFFGVRKNRASGLASACKACRIEEARIRRANHPEAEAAANRRYRAAHNEQVRMTFRKWLAANREHWLAQQAEWREQHKEERRLKATQYRVTHPEYLERARIWREAHPERCVEMHRGYYKANRDSCLEKTRVYWAEHPEQLAIYHHSRRARKRSAPGTHTAADIRAQRKRQKGKCFWCGESWSRPRCPNGHVDHVVPLKLGGSNSPENLVITCETCNLSKGTKHPMDFCGRLF